MDRIKKLIKKIKTKLLITKITKLIYSDTFPILTESDRNEFLNKVSDGHDKICLFKTYLVIQVITRRISFSISYSPIGKHEITEILGEIEKIEQHLQEKRVEELYNDTLDAVVKLHRLIAARQLRLASIYFESGRQKYKESPYSFEGMRYIREKSYKRPLSFKELEKCKKSAEEISLLDKKVKEAQEKYEESVSRLKAQVALDKIIQEVKEDTKETE